MSFPFRTSPESSDIIFNPLKRRVNWVLLKVTAAQFPISTAKTKKANGNRYEHHFFKIPSSDFKMNLFDEVESVFKKLRERKKIIGIFTLRKIELATHQIISSGLEHYIAKSPNFPNALNLFLKREQLRSVVSAAGKQQKILYLILLWLLLSII